MKSKLIILMLVMMPIASCFTQNQPKTKMTTKKSTKSHQDKLIIYQIFTRLFGNTKTTNKFYGTRDENGVGKFNDINDKALTELKKFGVSHVWFTGVIEHALMTDYSSFGIKKDNPQVVKGIAGSPYAIKDYYDVNPDLAVDVKNRMIEFEALIARSHKAGLKVIIDLVPNHLAREYHSDVKPAGVKDFGENDNRTIPFSNQNNFYYIPNQNFELPDGVNPPIKPDNNFIESPAKATGNDVFSAKPSINDWFETAKLNYGVDYQNGRAKHFETMPSTWLKMRDILTFWTKKGVDGFRCDMAEMVPVEYWSWVIPEIKKVNPATIFIAEIYNPHEYKDYIFNGKFDYLYDKVGLYDALRRLTEGKGNANDISKVWQNESGDFANHMVRFLENHDEQRIASKYFAGDAFKAIPAMIVSATLHDGPLMLYAGQEVGVNPTQAEGFSGEDGRTTIFDYWGVTELQNWVNDHKYDGGKLTVDQKKLRKFYADLIAFTTKSDAIKYGKFFDLQYVNNNGQSMGYNDSKIYTYVRYTNKQRLLFICNFDLENSYSTEIHVPELAWQMMNLNAFSKYKFDGIFGNKFSLEATTQEGLKVNIPKNSVMIFEIKP